jgi:hypothetical protein
LKQASHEFALTNSTVCSPPEREIRAKEAGQQTIAHAQSPANGFVHHGFHDRAFDAMKQYDQIFGPLFFEQRRALRNSR